MNKTLPPLCLASLMLLGCAQMEDDKVFRKLGGPVGVSVALGYLAVDEEPIHRRTSDRAAVVFHLAHDTESADFKFPAEGAVTFTPPTADFDCRTTNDRTVVCTRSLLNTNKYKYTIRVVRRGTGTDPDPLDPFIITH